MFEKLKSRTEWQAFVCTTVVYIAAIVAHVFFDVELDDTTMNLIWGQTAGMIGYAGSRGLSKIGSKVQEPSPPTN
jgi:hypothetical protein